MLVEQVQQRIDEIPHDSPLRPLVAALNSRLGELLGNMDKLANLGPNARAAFLQTRGEYRSTVAEQQLVIRLADIEQKILNFDGDYGQGLQAIVKELTELSGVLHGEMYLALDRLRRQLRFTSFRWLVDNDITSIEHAQFSYLVSFLDPITIAECSIDDLSKLSSKLTKLPRENSLTYIVTEQLFQKLLHADMTQFANSEEWLQERVKEIKLINPEVLFELWSNLIGLAEFEIITGAIHRYLGANPRPTDLSEEKIKIMTLFYQAKDNLIKQTREPRFLNNLPSIINSIEELSNSEQSPLLSPGWNRFKNQLPEIVYERLMQTETTDLQHVTLPIEIELSLADKLRTLGESEAKALKIRLQVICFHKAAIDIQKDSELSPLDLVEKWKSFNGKFTEFWGVCAEILGAQAEDVNIATERSLVRFTLRTLATILASKDREQMLELRNILDEKILDELGDHLKHNPWTIQTTILSLAKDQPESVHILVQLKKYLNVLLSNKFTWSEDLLEEQLSFTDLPLIGGLIYHGLLAPEYLANLHLNLLKQWVKSGFDIDAAWAKLMVKSYRELLFSQIGGRYFLSYVTVASYGKMPDLLKFAQRYSSLQDKYDIENLKNWADVVPDIRQKYAKSLYCLWLKLVSGEICDPEQIAAVRKILNSKHTINQLFAFYLSCHEVVDPLEVFTNDLERLNLFAELELLDIKANLQNIQWIKQITSPIIAGVAELSE